MRYTLRQIEYFVAAGDTLSITHASGAYRLQSRISRRSAATNFPPSTTPKACRSRRGHVPVARSTLTPRLGRNVRPRNRTSLDARRLSYLFIGENLPPPRLSWRRWRSHPNWPRTCDSSAAVDLELSPTGDTLTW
jgi:hypothetical protein